jgi:selT/selW/selH-like putative selenoprotein
VELVRGGGGIFDVWLDDELIFSKHDEGDFPSEPEVVARVRARSP